MSIRPLFQSSNKTFSFELYPPKTPEAESRLYENLERMKLLKPSFIAVTMGAMGTNKGNTFGSVERIERNYGIHGVAHLTCVNATRDNILDLIGELRNRRIQNLLCLRGDPPRASQTFQPPLNGFRYASELVSFVREKTGQDFSIGVAGYPEGHLECPDKEKDLLHLKQKVDAGAEYVLTQLFFDNRDYFDFVKKVRALNVGVRIIPGVMPVTSVSQLKTFTQMCGARIPEKMKSDLEKIQDDPAAVRRYGIDYAASQCEDLLAQGAPGIHFYTLNQAESVEGIYRKLKL